MLEAGAKVPKLTALDDQGRKFALADLKGTPYVIWFYPKASTPG
jgi:peroxiredoxin Q/BCP